MYSKFVHSGKSVCPIALAIVMIIDFGCKNGITAVDVSPKHFKLQIPFLSGDRGIIINTYWGTEREHHVLCLDNHSPSWIKSSAVQYTQSFRKSKNLGFRTSTADGSSIQGDVAICDSIFFQNIVFRNVPFYVMPDTSKDNTGDDGVFGIDALSKGIWKIDFKKEELTFVSETDSLGELRQADVFPATFDQRSISIDVDFGSGDVKKMAVDLGYNGEMLLPLRDLKAISASNKRFVTPRRFSTAIGKNIVNSVSFIDTVKINHDWFVTMVSSAEPVTAQLIGIAFFKRFDYVIFDFINKRIYVAKKVW